MQRRAWMELPQNRFLRGIYLLVQRYLRHNVGMQGAALAFYLLFMIFPLLIFVSSLLGLLQLDVDAILAAVQEFLPPGRSCPSSGCTSPMWAGTPV